MTVPFIALAVCVIGALALLAAVAGVRRPEEGWFSWVQSSFSAFREDKPAGLDGGAVDVGINDLLSAESDAIGYLSPDALKGRIVGARKLVHR